jgi:hypothetical protein
MTRLRYQLLGVVLATAVVDFAGLSLGWWWVTTLTAVAVAVAVRGRAGLAALLVGTMLGWAGALLWQSGSRTVEVANLVSAMAFNSRQHGWVVLIVTFTYAVLLALAGAWLGAAARRVVAGARANRAVESEQAEETPYADQEVRTEEEERV